MNPEIVNLYIERMLKEIEELTKNRLLVDTQLKYTEMLNAQLQVRVKELEIDLEKQSKKINKKEVNTSSENF
jgi:hypothetical protein